ncbi:uncharacterized protein LOC110224155 [Arabidopsis lyrata subsp. lyrata]|uniref:uncharacterized protein LOC110224155 n=1 Tax=Arabidopsis lyrata subsp. lyrata TaxID=81972 RepID=UPI000A29A77D|nr:uncharacterized protein LOC110224155 [Arabidopsis lyrata subsp. lyrata]|eukprot:XP_020887746.1 uncharacterized protein LOC110224155 [Arabidopsis lyrata subsp. lyrata]
METSYPRESESGSETTRGSQEEVDNNEALSPLHSDLPPTTDADLGDTNLPASSSPTLPVLPDDSGAIVGASDSVLANSSPLESTSAVEEEKDSDQANNNPAKSTTAVEEQKDSDEEVLCAKPLSFVDGKAAPVVPSNVCLKAGRRSKRLRTFSSKLDERFHFDKKIKGLVGHPSPLVVGSNQCVDPEERFQGSLKKLKATSSVSLGGDILLANKDIFELIERKKHLNNKVLDALIKFSRHILRVDDGDGEKLRIEVLDSKFVSQLTRLYYKFSKSDPLGNFIFPSPLIDILRGAGDPERVELFSEADFHYLPFNFDKKHWVALCVDLNGGKIVVLDSNYQLRKDAALQSELQPLAVMLPFLLKQAAFNPSMKQLPVNPFSIERPLSIPQVSSPFDSGVVSVFLIHVHATGGLEECNDFDVGAIESEVKKLVCAIMIAGVAS